MRRVDLGPSLRSATAGALERHDVASGLSYPGSTLHDVLDVPHSVVGLEPAEADLYEEARLASLKAYPKISGLHVGAALRTADGSTFSGFNIEDASLWQVVHAEQAAVLAAISKSGPDVE